MLASMVFALIDPRLGDARWAPPENTRSTGVLVAGMAKDSLAMAARRGHSAALVFHHCRTLMRVAETGPDR